MITETPTGPVFMETPASAIPHIGRETVFVDRRQFLIERPTDSDKLLDDPAIRDANVKDDYMPYWADIWPAARMMAKAILREPWERFPLHAGDRIEALELGCGLGLAGIVGLARGLRVTFTDYDLTALRFAARNAKLNGFTDFRTMPLDWRFPPENQRFPLIIAADLTYELRNIDPLVALIKKMLLPRRERLSVNRPGPLACPKAPGAIVRRRIDLLDAFPACRRAGRLSDEGYALSDRNRQTTRREGS